MALRTRFAGQLRHHLFQRMPFFLASSVIPLSPVGAKDTVSDDRAASTIKVHLPIRAIGVQLPSRAFCSQSPSEQSRQLPGSWHFPVDVGSKLQVKLPRGAPGLTVGVNSDPESIGVQSFSEALKVDYHRNTVRITAEEDLDEEVEAWVPERFCSIDIKAGEKGRVSVADVNQGDLSIETKGQSVSLGKIRSEKVYVKTLGGSVTAKMLSGDTQVSTSAQGNVPGGSLTVGKVLGKNVSLRSRGGNVTIGSVYAEEFDLCSTSDRSSHERGPGTGNIHIETLGIPKIDSPRPFWYLQTGPPSLGISVLPKVALLTEEERKDKWAVAIRFGPPGPLQEIKADLGNIQIDKLDGCAIVSTRGGNISIQMTERTQFLEIQMDGGDLTLSVPSSDKCPMHRIAETPFIKYEGENLVILADPKADPIMKSHLWEERSEDMYDILARVTKDWKIIVGLRGKYPRRITIKQGRNWMDALREKVSEAKPTS